MNDLNLTCLYQKADQYLSISDWKNIVTKTIFWSWNTHVCMYVCVFEQPGVVEGVPAMARGLELDDF